MKNILVAMVREPCLMLNYSLKWDEGQGENLPKTRYGNSSPTPTPHIIPTVSDYEVRTE